MKAGHVVGHHMKQGQEVAGWKPRDEEFEEMCEKDETAVVAGVTHGAEDQFSLSKWDNKQFLVSFSPNYLTHAPSSLGCDFLHRLCGTQ